MNITLEQNSKDYIVNYIEIEYSSSLFQNAERGTNRLTDRQTHIHKQTEIKTLGILD